MPKKTATKKAPAKKAAAVAETKAEKFARLGSMRTTKAINAMRGLQKLSNTANYDYTPEQVAKIVDALKTEVEGVFNAFNKPEAAAEDAFTL